MPASCGSTPEFANVDVGDVTLNVACQGDGPTVLLLHGFPEFWYGWTDVMNGLAGDHRVVVPDQRGYNLSDKPDGLDAYKIDKLVADMVALIDTLDAPVHLVGHDWGGVVAWGLASLFPDKIESLVIANGPHPNVFAREYTNNPEQKAASSYVSFFISPGAEDALSANNYGALAGAFAGALNDEQLDVYKEAWAQPGALTATLNWYRANFDAEDGPQFAGEYHIDVPTLVLWGEKDTALLIGNIAGLDDYVSDLTIQTYDDATHWIGHDKPAEVAAEIAAFVATHD